MTIAYVTVENDRGQAVTAMDKALKKEKQLKKH